MNTDSETLKELVAEISRFEAIINEWDETQRGVVVGLKRAIETLHKVALTRLIKSVKAESLPALKNAVQDEVVYGVLLYHHLVKAPISPLEMRLKTAIDTVNLQLKEHGGEVELVTVKLPDTVEVKFQGNCQNCASVNLTLSNLIVATITSHCPEIKHVIPVK